MAFPTALKLNADQVAVVTRTLTQMGSLTRHMAELVRDATLTDEHAKTLLSLSELYVADLSKHTGVPTQSEADVTERNSKLREANSRVAALEQLLGGRNTPEDSKLGIRAYAETVKETWRTKGFGYAADVHFSDWGTCQAKLSCILLGEARLLHSETPVTDEELKKQWRKELEEQGFVLLHDDRAEDRIVDCDASRAALYAMVARLWPSCKITEIRSHSAGSSRTMCLREVSVMFSDLGELQPTNKETMEGALA